MESLKRGQRWMGLLMSLGGAAMLLYGSWTHLEEARQFSRLRPAEGRLLEAELNPVGPGARELFLRLRYSYTVDGKSHPGIQDLALDGWWLNRLVMRRIRDRLKEEQEAKGRILVHYLPARPRQSEIVVFVNPMGFMLCGMGLGGVFMGVSFLSRSIRRSMVLAALGRGSVMGAVVAPYVAFLVVRDLGYPALSWSLGMWTACVMGSWLLAIRHPGYVHAPEMASLFGGHPGPRPRPSGLLGLLFRPRVLEGFSRRVNGSLERKVGPFTRLPSVTFDHEGARTLLAVRRPWWSEKMRLVLAFSLARPISCRCRVTPPGAPASPGPPARMAPL